MARQQPISALADFLPPRAFDLVKVYFEKYPIKLSVRRERKTILGDYRPPSAHSHMHRISVNGTLSPQHFLITLLHELAHLLVYVHISHRVQPHGREWKETFSRVLRPFVERHLFEHDVTVALSAYLQNPAASSCSDPHLYRVLQRYDDQGKEGFTVEALALQTVFSVDGGRRFRKLKKLRTRYQCVCLQTGQVYLFQGLMKVQPVEEPGRSI